MATPIYDAAPEKFMEASIVVLRKGERREMIVLWHKEGTVRCGWEENGERHEENFSAHELKYSLKT